MFSPAYLAQYLNHHEFRIAEVLGEVALLKLE
jgi:hypothetical protein